MENKTKYYICKCVAGHVGIHSYLPISIPIKANSAKEAADKAKTKPRVKKNRKGVVLETREVTYTEFLRQYAINDENPYFKCHSIQEQRQLCNLDGMLEYDDYYDAKTYNNSKDSRFDRIKRKRRMEELKYNLDSDYVSESNNIYD